MIVVAGHVQIDPTHREEAITVTKTMMEKTREEPGCITYVMSADLVDDGKFWIFEEWDSKEALTKHFQAPHMAEFQAAIAKVGIRGMTIEEYAVESKGPLG